MSLWTSLEPASATVEAGDSTRVRLRVRNTGDVVDEYRFEPVGEVAPWTRVEPQTLRLYPGTTGTVELTFAPPRSPDATAGPNPYAVRITPTEHPDAVTVPEGNLTILPFTEVRAELVPVTVRGRFRGRPRLAVDNLGNTPLTASISGSDNGDQLSYEIHPANVQIQPGRAAFVKARLSPEQVTWVGPSEERPYTLAVQRSGTEPLPVDGTYHQLGVVPRWLATVFGILLTLAIMFLVLWFAYRPRVTSAATASPAAAGDVLPPAPTPEVTEAPPEPTEEPEEEKPAEEEEPAPEPEPEPEGEGGGGGAPPLEEPDSTVPARDVMLRNVYSERCADVPGRGRGEIGAVVQQATCTVEGDNQLWHLEVMYPEGGPESRPLFQIVNATDGLCMDLPGSGGTPSRTRITEHDCDGTTDDNQLWWLEERGEDRFWIRNFASNGLCLDVNGLTREPEAPLAIFTCLEDDDQEWEILRPLEDEGGDE
ncbi:RICIN domain-containing protein [Streptomyces millisiae]|uniref:RICIN domain-containing protein n=1 Tax=Streptomyces millisiae TaxID=3075542 RepID=A0ABU2LXU3_9ACTN|nr:RICIN domain-containing protein [Streptomyces sp. DSM 44918]MDT0322379.1 RICIN domain-containing protein [Streptomyces sp. DSM 44918]